MEEFSKSRCMGRQWIRGHSRNRMRYPSRPRWDAAGCTGSGRHGAYSYSHDQLKKLSEMHTTFHHNSYSWSEFPGVVIDQQQKLVGLKFRWYHKELKEEMVSVEALYTRSRDFNKLIDFLEKHLPDVPFTEGKVQRGP
ncbi:hypothetical protein FA471_31420 [Pseudomonas aeruginosa]|nr:hypothetical protein [Pseudomonas aeruginosa]